MRASRMFGIAATLVLGAASQATILFSDTFDSDTSANYTVIPGHRDTTNPGSPADSSAVFGVDYSAIIEGATTTNIPPAPGSADTFGLLLKANGDATNTTSTDSISAVPNIASSNGNLEICVDMFNAFIFGGTSTFFASAGLQHDGATPFLHLLSGTGITATWAGDGGAAQDYRFYSGITHLLTSAGGYNSPSFNQDGGTSATYSSWFMSPPYGRPGVPGNQWCRMRIQKIVLNPDDEQPTHQITWYIDQHMIARINVQGVGDGKPMVGAMDIFTSVKPDGTFTVMDNLKYGSLELIKGSVLFEDYDNFTNPITSAVVQILDPNDFSVIQTENVTLDANGNFVCAAPLTPGQYLASVKGKHWLRQNVPIDTTGGSVTGLSFSLVNGDIDGDNQVGLLDYDIFSAFYDRTSGDADWGTVDPGIGFAPRDADVDGDNAVTLLDYDIFSKNFDKLGDAP